MCPNEKEAGGKKREAILLVPVIIQQHSRPFSVKKSAGFSIEKKRTTEIEELWGNNRKVWTLIKTKKYTSINTMNN